MNETQPLPTDAELRGVAVVDAGMYQEDDTAEWHVPDLALLKFARAVLAKWGTPPAVAGEPYAYAVYFPDQPTEELVHDLDELCDDLTNREHTITNLYATPQPTQAQAGAVPLTDAQIDQAIAELGLNYLADAHATNRAVLQKLCRHAHGIKGGQHG